ncbi:MAG: ACT domain-containing protein, partial [Alphaproteobacteria bacterium]
LCPLEQVSSRFYLRLAAADEPGVFARIGEVLGRKNISISSCLQHETVGSDSVPVVIMTHKARQGDMDKALTALAQLDVIKEKPVCIHVVSLPEG